MQIKILQDSRYFNTVTLFILPVFLTLCFSSPLVEESVRALKPRVTMVRFLQVFANDTGIFSLVITLRVTWQ